MANRAYLIVTDDQLPRAWEAADFSPEEQIVAQGRHSVPLLWFAPFRASDLPLRASEEGVDLDYLPPRTTTEMAVTQLDESLDRLREMFGSQGDLIEHAWLLREAITSAGRQYVTINAFGIYDFEEFNLHFRQAVGALARELPMVIGNIALKWLCGVESSWRFPPARCQLDGNRPTQEGTRIHGYLLGYRWRRPVPWEDDQPLRLEADSEYPPREV